MPAIQLSTPEAMAGKVMSMAAAVSMCAQPLGQMVYGWAYDQIKIKKIDPAAKTITLADPHAYGVRSNTPPKGSRLYVDKADLKVRGYQAFNLIE